MTTSIKLTNINKYFGQGIAKVHVLKDLNFSAQAGELILILGPSGSGKSTFLTIAGGLQTPTSGQVAIEEQEIANLKGKQREQLRLNKIGFILQAYNLVPYLTVAQQFSLVDKVKKTPNIDAQAFQNILVQLDIQNLLHMYPDHLSGGQKQRVAIARALYANPEIILADEPTAALDSQRVTEVGNLLSDLAHQQNKAIIVVTHDIRVEKFADKIYELQDGMLVEKQK
ncbi:ABC transporter ATP-binding protein [Ligilactobacillus equi]|uniref:Putative hemin import ATP-binding protein HrtA n=1 Tax=Ligilactobacillus equi DSM 15833 = JCM 10991 TaxID=1423740 RepID=A0A0R1T2U4_9LACO|nr:ABC transporter ATP-binding protein [Ligilactobacillus equi]KRL75933.1 abc transporter atp-binding protein [Ligilactobacillus equi DSM 15833 = JCM 10991]